MPKIGILTQARMTSTRLPGKIMLTANGIPVIQHHINRLVWSNIPVYIATTNNSTDQPVATLANSLKVPCYRGDEHHVLQRFYECAKQFNLKIIVRVTSDCPLIDGHVIAEGMTQYLKLSDKNVYYSNCLIRTFPRGLDFEIFSFDLLEDAFQHAINESDKEHVTPYINQNKSKKSIIRHHTSDQNHSNLRWTLDTEDDWKLIKSLLEDYHVADLPYTEILKIVEQHPELAAINNHIKQKEIDL